MSTESGRVCVASKQVRTASGGTARRCARFSDSGEVHADHYRGGFADIGNLTKWNVSGADLLLGAGIGLAGVAAAKYVTKLDAVSGMVAKLPEPVQKLLPLAGGLAAGGIAYVAGKKDMGRARGHFLGATVLSAGVTAWDMLRASAPTQLGDPVVLTYGGYNGSGYGMVTTDVPMPALQGFNGGYGAVIDDPRPGMAELAAISMAPEDDDE